MSLHDWKKINEALVRCGELPLDLNFVQGWQDKLEAMNKGKEGALFRYPDSFIRLLLFIARLPSPALSPTGKLHQSLIQIREGFEGSRPFEHPVEG